MTSHDRIVSHSSVIDKAPPDILEQVDRAIVKRDPPGYKAIYLKFDLASRGLRYKTFWRYAHKLRFNADLAKQVQAMATPQTDPAECALRLLAIHLQGLLRNRPLNPRHVRRAVEAYSRAVWIWLNERRPVAKVIQPGASAETVD